MSTSIEVPLTGGFVAQIDAADAPLVLPYRWRVLRCLGIYYAVRWVGLELVLMHRVITGLAEGDTRDVDHRDHDGLNNCRHNLRVCSDSQNQANRLLSKNNGSGFKGVSLNKHTRRWHAYIRVDLKRINLGFFRKPWSAALAYDFAAVKHFGAFALTNGDMGLYDGVAA